MHVCYLCVRGLACMACCGRVWSCAGARSLVSISIRVPRHRGTILRVTTKQIPFTGTVAREFDVGGVVYHNVGVVCVSGVDSAAVRGAP